MKKEWNRLHPFILTDDKNPVAPLISSLDEQFRTGPTHKLPAAFQIFNVR